MTSASALRHLRVAILGASGQIARGLTEELVERTQLHLFTRDPSRLAGSRPYASFQDFEYDVIINAAGPGDPRTIRPSGADIFRITEYFDNLVLDYLAQRPSARYVFLSTGAVYQNGYTRAASHELQCMLPIDGVLPEMYYPLAKLYAEMKHRALAGYDIADIRVFGYFSRHISLSGGFFLSDVANAVVSGRPFRTNAANFYRDYICAADIVRLIGHVVERGHVNAAFDLVSAAPVSKAELLSAMTALFGLRIELNDPASGIEPLQSLASLSDNRAASDIGYAPLDTSLQIVQREMEALLAATHR